MYHRECGQSSSTLYRASRGNGFDDHYDRYDRYGRYGRYYECTRRYYECTRLSGMYDCYYE